MAKLIAKQGHIIGNLEVIDEWERLSLEERTPDKAHAAYIENNKQVAHILWQQKRELKALRIAAASATEMAYQTLVTDAANLTSHTLNGVTATRSKLTTKSATPIEFNWPECKRQDSALVIVGVGDGVAKHAFLVNHTYNTEAFNVGYDGAGGYSLHPRPACIPVQGAPTEICFVAFVEDTGSPNNIKVIPVNIAYGTTVYLHQRMPGE